MRSVVFSDLSDGGTLNRILPPTTTHTTHTHAQKNQDNNDAHNRSSSSNDAAAAAAADDDDADDDDADDDDADANSVSALDSSHSSVCGNFGTVRRGLGAFWETAPATVTRDRQWAWMRNGVATPEMAVDQFDLVVVCCERDAFDSSLLLLHLRLGVCVCVCACARACACVCACVCVRVGGWEGGRVPFRAWAGFRVCSSRKRRSTTTG